MTTAWYSNPTCQHPETRSSYMCVLKREAEPVAQFRVPGFDFDVPVVIDPNCGHEGIVKYGGHYNRPTIYLREPNDRVLLHETLHVLVASDPNRTLTPGSEEEEAFVRHLTHLYELGWRSPHEIDSAGACASTQDGRADHANSRGRIAE